MDVELFTKRLVLVCVKVLHPVVMVLCYSDDMRGGNLGLFKMCVKYVFYKGYDVCK